jgi:hypothetical protein
MHVFQRLMQCWNHTLNVALDLLLQRLTVNDTGVTITIQSYIFDGLDGYVTVNNKRGLITITINFHTVNSSPTRDFRSSRPKMSELMRRAGCAQLVGPSAPLISGSTVRNCIAPWELYIWVRSFWYCRLARPTVRLLCVARTPTCPSSSNGSHGRTHFFMFVWERDPAGLCCLTSEEYNKMIVNNEP